MRLAEWLETCPFKLVETLFIIVYDINSRIEVIRSKNALYVYVKLFFLVLFTFT